MKRFCAIRIDSRRGRRITLGRAVKAIFLLCCCSGPAPRTFADTPPAIEHVIPPPPPGPPDTTPPPSPVQIGLSSIALNFENIVGSGLSSQQVLQVIIYSDNLGVTWQVSAQTSSGGGWLSVSPNYGRDDVNLTVAANSLGLAKGTYTGKLTITCNAAVNSPAVVDVTYTIRDPLPSALQLSSAALSFGALASTQSPAAQQITISAKGESSLGSWRASASTFNGGNWLSATPASGSGPANVNVAADLGSLPGGAYAGQITITSDGTTNSPLKVPVTFTVTPQKVAFSQEAVVNAASFAPGPLAPGEIGSVFGAWLGPRTGVAAALDLVTQKLPLQLAGTTVTFDGVAAPLFFSSYGQVTFQVPFELAGKTSSQMVVSVDGEVPATATVSLQDAAPGLFTLDNTRAVVLNQDSTVNGPQQPAAVGSIIQIFFTGR